MAFSFGSCHKFNQFAAKANNMAKQAGILQITGTISNLTFYEMGGQYYVRLKSSLSGKRVKTSPAFALTMLYAERLAMCSQTASQLYRSLPKEKQQVVLYRKMTGTAMRLLKAGIPAEVLAAALAAIYTPAPASCAPKKPVRKLSPRAVVTPSGQLEWDPPVESNYTKGRWEDLNYVVNRCCFTYVQLSRILSKGSIVILSCST